MQLRGLLFLGLVLGTEASNIARFRAAAAPDAKLVRRASTDDDSSSEAAADPTSTAVAVVTATSTVADSVSTTAEDTSVSTSQADTGSTSDSSDNGGVTTSTSEADKTVTKTVTVTDADADTITKSTTVLKTMTSTIVVTSTTFKTATVTSSGETATSTVYETSTKWANEKRALNIAPRTVGENGIVFHEAQITQAPELDDDEDEYQLLRPRDMVKRDTVTVTTTVTVGGDDGKTVTKSATRTVISTVSSATKITKTLTETEQADASTTVTVTSTLTVTSTRVTTGVVQTATVAPSGSYGNSGDSSSDSSSSSSGGLSTGAKAGIGAGAGVVGLAVLGLLLWCCLKRRNKPSKSELDDMFGSSEVPVGPGPGHGSSARLSSHMSQISPTIPNVTPVKSPAPEGYRGTALGDGRAGYAKPKPFGAAYAPAPAVSPEGTYSRTATVTSAGDEHMEVPPHAVELGNDGNAAKWHQANAAEIDGNQVTSPRGSSPPEHVYEMPAQQFR